MYTNLKVREDFGDLKPEEGKDFAYGGWYQNPPGTRAIAATRVYRLSLFLPIGPQILKFPTKARIESHAAYTPDARERSQGLGGTLPRTGGSRFW